MNGVIVDDEPLHMAAFRNLLQAYGLALSEREYNDYFAGRTDEDGLALYFKVHHEPLSADMAQLLQTKASAYQKLAAGQLTPFPGVVEFIRELANQKQLVLALVTSSLRVEAMAVLDTFNVRDCFKALVTADDITKGKPDPEGYLKGAAALGIDPTECLVVEDAPSGVKAAHAAGMQCLVVLNTYGRDELSDADAIVERLKPGCLDKLEV